MSKDRFDLEQEIMSCWGVVDDLKRLLNECEAIEDPKVADRVQNIVLGLEHVYDMRFQELWNTFEYLVGVKDGKFSI